MCENRIKKIEYAGVDLFKLIASILVVLLHAVETNAWYPCGVKYIFTRLAVPFFFIASGFFFYNGLCSSNDKKDYFVRYEKRLLILLFLWEMVINLPFTISEYLKKYSGVRMFKLLLYLFRRIFIIGSGPYWYLVALIWSAGYLYWCFSIRSDKLVYAGVIVGLTLETVYACFGGAQSSIDILAKINRLVYLVFSWEYNFIMFGIPFMGIGFLIAKNKSQFSPQMAGLGLLVFTIIRTIEYYLPLIIPSSLWQNNAVSFAFIGQAYSYFMLAKGIRVSDVIKKKTRTIRQLSTWFYFSHAIVLYNILNPVLEKYTPLPVYSGEMIIPKVVVVLVICTTFFAVIKRINNKYLNILITG